MAYLGSWKIDDYLPIPVTTHRFSTGAAYAPTSLTYSIYEDATTTGLVEDVDMTPASPFDGVTGFYLARRQLTAAAGFEKGKNYTVLIKATVDGVAAIAAHTFQIEAEVDANVVSDKTGYGLAAGSVASAAEIWSYTNRTLTQAAASVTAAVSGSDITGYCGDTLSFSLTGLGVLTGYSKVYFSIKRDLADVDSASVVMIEKTAGLQYINGAAGTAGNGTLTIDDEAAGNITVTLKASETVKIDPGLYNYDVKVVRSAGTVSTLTQANFTWKSDVTKATT